MLNFPDDPALRVERHGRILFLVLHRPASRNALSSSLISALQQAMIAAEQDGEIRVVVLTGTDPAFCAGLDLKELRADAASFGIGQTPPGSKVGHPWAPLSKPIIGAVNGAAFTGGLELALHCDVLIASERAVFADTHAKFGLLPTWGMSVLLSQAVGRATARQMTLTAQPIDAQQALNAGLVSMVTPHEELLPAATALAHAIAGNRSDVVRALLQGMRAMDGEQHAAALAREASASRRWQDVGARARRKSRRAPGGTGPCA